MLRYKLKFIKLILALIVYAFALGCAKRQDGFAPSIEQPIIAAPNGQWEYELNFSEKVSTVNSWEALLDTNDVVEHLSLANGWNVEVSND